MIASEFIILDFDGTIADFAPEGATTRINHALLRTLTQQGVRRIGIYTNQGGLLFGVAGLKRKDGRPYPTPEKFLCRLADGLAALGSYGITVADVRVSCWHAAAGDNPALARAMQTAAARVRAGLGATTYRWTVYTTPAARKPRGDVLRWMGATAYYGDSPEDAAAAADAGVPFVAVERFP